MFKVQTFTNRAYRTVATASNPASMFDKLRTVHVEAKFRVLNDKGVKVLTGRVVADETAATGFRTVIETAFGRKR